MRGTLLIERETTDGDRAIVDQVDVGGLLSGVDPLAVARAKAFEALDAPAVFAVRVIHDRGDGELKTVSRVDTLTKREV